jgi:hypothetical protein
MKLAKLVRELKHASRAYATLLADIERFDGAAETAMEQGLIEEFEAHRNELVSRAREMQAGIQDLMEQIEVCVANGDMEKAPRQKAT